MLPSFQISTIVFLFPLYFVAMEKQNVDYGMCGVWFYYHQILYAYSFVFKEVKMASSLFYKEIFFVLIL